MAYDSLSLEEDRAAKMSCLKSAYFLAELLVNSFLKHIDTVLLRQGIDKIFFNKFMKKIDFQLKFDLGKLHSYYTTVNFRNKLIGHNDHVRQEAKLWSEKGEFYYLPHAYDLDSGEIERISILRKSYLDKSDSEELKNEINLRQILEFLFYNYPSFEVLKGGMKYSISLERREIDNLSKKIGIKSTTCPKNGTWRNVDISSQFQEIISELKNARLNPKDVLPQHPEWKHGDAECYLSISASKRMWFSIPSGPTLLLTYFQLVLNHSK
jgi:hypothetical protein